MEEKRRKEDKEGCTNRSIPLRTLRELRQSRGLTQRELSTLANVSAGTVFQLENTRRGAYPVTIRKLATALGVAPAHLVGGRRPE
jgi:transcriptional regulator with XRE-family HTH domain